MDPRTIIYKEDTAARRLKFYYILLFFLSALNRVKMRMVLFLATTLLLILLMSPEVTSQSDCYIKSNGCSVPFGLPFFYKKTFTPACVKHDVCYSCVRFGMSLLICVIFISSNRTILVRFGCISGEFGRAMFVFQRDIVGPKYPWRERA